MKDGKRAPTASLPEAAGDIERARLIAGDGAAARVVVLGSMPIKIGSSPSCALVLDDPHVSGEHLAVRLAGDGVHIEDLGSRNGTRVNGVSIESTVLARSGVISAGKTHMRLELDHRGARVADFHGVVGRSEQMVRVLEILGKLAATEVSVMLLGETGTGKDVLARALHAAGARAGAPFAVFDCGAVAPNLIESDLFGHQKGAFTGAVSDRAGVFERGDGGTVFLDEVGELPLELQPRLLRVLEQRQVRRVGGAELIGVDVRVIAATNRDLEEDVRAGRFRSDLFFRLSAAVVHIPPLRERLSDLGDLVAAFLAERDPPLQASPATLRTLESYDWPGNVRELKNVITSAAALADGVTLEPRHLLFFKRASARASTLDDLPLGGRTLEALEAAAIKQTLEQTNGNKSRTARILGIAPSTLYEKLKKLGLHN